MTTKIDVFVDYVCPFCFLVEPAIEELKRDRDVEVTIRPFELRPDPVPTLRPEDEYLPRVWKQSVYPMSDRVGLPITLPSISPQPRTDKAFMVLQLAQERGLAEAYTEAMFSAFFQQDRNIGLDEVIIDVAASVGLDKAEVEEALRSEERRDRQLADQDYAVNTVGIDSVPGIVIEGQVLRGVPSASRLKKVVGDLADRKAASGQGQA
ncbi:DsbA family protein [Kytococcus sedentarius]|uniref:Predicted dithiol-disulfide isomerase involved in polyketide biosynthesis n=1 Tax=Kytococcus sedentarius (strain ATCC 14392 / DSM 20547 / JCM 11482 / CCUG 33030 / NBRC 15357 / NCTC 11040 / CCM 314 / 541) TaxID=478801 RepID=C7NIW3_KYTSD|nr:DsbA family protein [Kytococcus sedentarius]ACV05188.1 predicted dithiol-disulfide isomerase involved in polyketide biosynthesis [Kytococcus sedentarius DSM 20547]QQB63654.1 DsbA family protein [Kytococcus sedentarius]STX13405.1 Protein-disulfide isomerase [Kytococcus sedentarius]